MKLSFSCLITIHRFNSNLQEHVCVCVRVWGGGFNVCYTYPTSIFGYMHIENKDRYYQYHVCYFSYFSLNIWLASIELPSILMYRLSTSTHEMFRQCLRQMAKCFFHF